MYMCGNCLHTEHSAPAMYVWQIVGELFIPWGSTVQWYQSIGSVLLILGTKNATQGVTAGWNRIVKKQSFKSIITIFQFRGIIAGEGNVGWRAPMSSIALFIWRKSWSNRHFPLYFLITSTGEFQGLVVRVMCPNCNCSWTSSWRAVTFSAGSGHWFTHTGLLVLQVSLMHGHLSMVAIKNFLESSG